MITQVNKKIKYFRKIKTIIYLVTIRYKTKQI